MRRVLERAPIDRQSGWSRSPIAEQLGHVVRRRDSLARDPAEGLDRRDEHSASRSRWLTHQVGKSRSGPRPSST